MSKEGQREWKCGGGDCMVCWEETMKRRGVWESGRKVAPECQSKKRDFPLKEAEVLSTPPPPPGLCLLPQHPEMLTDPVEWLFSASPLIEPFISL